MTSEGLIDAQPPDHCN